MYPEEFGGLEFYSLEFDNSQDSNEDSHHILMKNVLLQMYIRYVKTI